MNSMAARRSAQPLYWVYLAWVINIPPVQCHREAVTDDRTAQFFSEGCRPNTLDFQWSLDEPDAFPWGPVASAINPVSLPMQHAWNAAFVAFVVFIDALAFGELIASGVNPNTGARCEIDSAEWMRTGLILDVRNGDLIEVGQGKRTVRWSAITLRAAKQPRQNKARWHGYDWDGAWAYALTLRAENQWDWTEHQRDKRQPLPALHRTVEEMIERWFAARGSIPAIEDIRRNIVAPLYAGKHTRPRRKR
jgi:hypothetical protein